ncbi:MAG TPA: hypothetical protein VKU19_40095 [Bryobacteraceae bacterium]|nr:hypothetical protein [Bryobacteraceae bacterium]
MAAKQPKNTTVCRVETHLDAFRVYTKSPRLVRVTCGKWTIGIALLAAGAFAQQYADNLPIAHPAIRYFESDLTDPASSLAKRLESGAAQLDFESGPFGYLPSLLQHLDLTIDSQTLVFSKTSFQSSKISPRNPRAIYFNDSVAIGYVPGGEVLEVASLDPRQGVVFYTLDAQKSDRPLLHRRDVCLKCHQGPATQGVPGIFVGSVFPNPMGSPSPAGAIITDHRTAFADRWGGWLLSSLGQGSRADSVAIDPAEPETLSRVRPVFDASRYLSPTSDPVALMTLEHQTQMTNLLTRLGWEARMGAGPSDKEIAAVVRYMTFADEAPLRHPLAASAFSKAFARRGPCDRQGRSLRDFDLQTRLFRYPLSFMVYSPQFEALPAAIKARIGRALDAALAGTAALDVWHGPRAGG